MEPLAVVGIGCRLPGHVVDAESYWQLLAEGRSGIVEVPSDRWSLDRYYHADASIPGRMVSKWGGFVGNVDTFDARFWGITPREAMRMDPQQRWLLEVAWEAIEDAGIAPSSLRGSATGVFVGVSTTDYATLQMPNFAEMDVHTISGNTMSIVANRISYLLDLKGPSLSVDTACSSSLVALALACRTVWSGECQAALAGGVNALIAPNATIGFSKASMLSPDGQCFAFDARANGYVRGEGAGMVLIKRLADAVAHGDPIYALIRSVVLNQDGNTSSMTVPDYKAQSDMLRKAYREAGIPPSRVAYMEAHGTGTPVGDPIELAALGRILSQGRSEDRPCLIGSVKSNIGHLEAGSGIAGLIKAALVLQRGAIPPSLNFETPNPRIPFGQLKLKVATGLQPLPQHDGLPSVTAVNSFGFGGANAHVVLEAAPKAVRRARKSRGKKGSTKRAKRPLMLALSARDDEGLQRYAESYRQYLKEPTRSLPDVCFSAGARKEHHPHRLVVLGRDAESLRQSLVAWRHSPESSDQWVQGQVAVTRSPLTFVFTGQGAQWWGMGRQLLDREPLFRETLSTIDQFLVAAGGPSLLEEMKCNQEASRIHETHIAQPMIFALQVALVELWRSWGITPDRVVGHSVGEVAAAYTAGIYSLADAVQVIYHRSRLQNMMGGKGRMLAAGISPSEARELIGYHADRIHITAINSANLVTLGGDTEPLLAMADRLEQSGKFVRLLDIDYAFHTHQMEPIRQELLDSLANIQPRPEHTTFVSTVTGGALPGDSLDASYWWLNVRKPVMFGPAVTQLIQGGSDVFVEIGPHPALASSIKECLAESSRKGAVYHSLRRESDESTEILRNLAGLHVLGVPIDWAAVNQSDGVFVRLPRFPWKKEKYWLEADDFAYFRLAPDAHPLLGHRVTAEKPTYEFTLDPKRFTYLDDHRFFGSILFPAAGYGEIAVALACELFPNEPYAVEELVIRKALFVLDGSAPTVRVVFDPSDRSFSIYSSSGSGKDWELHVQGRLTRRAQDPPSADLESIKAQSTQLLGHEEYYARLAKSGYEFGESFRLTQRVWRGGVETEALSEVIIPERDSELRRGYHFHPAILDALFHGCKAASVAPGGRTHDNDLFLPSRIGRIQLHRPELPQRLFTHGIQRSHDGRTQICDLFIYDEAGQCVAEVVGFQVELAEHIRESEDADQCLYQFEWSPARLKGSGMDGPCHFPPVHDLVAHVQQRMPALSQQYRLDDYARDFAPRMERVVRQLIVNAFWELGWRPETGQKFSWTQFQRELEIIPQHHQLARANLQALEADGIVRSDGPNGWKVLREPQVSSVEVDLALLASDYPRLKPEIELVRTTASSLAGVLSGQVDPMEVLFPGGSLRPLERFYVESVDFPVQNRLFAEAIAQAVAALPPRRVIRILEVGGGTASLTRAILPVLPADRTEYLFTDISMPFLTSARQDLAEFPFVEFQAFDIERSPQDQGIDPHRFDLILATNVLHATKDLKSTLANLKECLAPQGMLWFLEVVRRRVTWDNVFGLLKGWWQFQDTGLRPESALLPRARWVQLLSEAGFASVDSFVATPVEDDVEQAVFVATGLDVPSLPAKGPSGSSGAQTGRRYLVFADDGGWADALIDRIEQGGDVAIRVTAGPTWEPKGDRSYSVSPESTSDLQQVVSAHAPLAGVVHCWSLDQPRAASLTSGQLGDSQQLGVLSGLRLVHVLAGIEANELPRVYFITREMCRVLPTDANDGLAAAPLIGFCRVANNEHPKMRWTTIDLGDGEDATEQADFYGELVHGDDEREVAYRGGIRFARRLRRVRGAELSRRLRNAVQADGQTVPFRIQMDRAGILSQLTLNETTRRDPEPDQIEMRVMAGGINFRDVMKALGMLPGKARDALWFGDDYAGIVERVGAHVTRWRPGDRVLGMTAYSFRSHVAADQRLVMRMPPDMAYSGAATIPTVFLTALFAIRELARMQKGESILIHAGAGGVGLAAIQVARQLQLEIFCTAGTPEKRQLLRDLGIAHVMDSRTLDFAEQIREVTQGKGVDMVLNSLAGDFIPKSFSVLAPFGRFVEIGKVDIYNNSKLGLERFKENISYFVFDLVQYVYERSERVAEVCQELEAALAAGVYQPLPHTTFPAAEVADAFRYMAQGKHVGKNVLTFDGESIPIGTCTEEGHRFRPDATYLITGGAGGFGLEIGREMARQGCRHLVLLSRSGPHGDQARADLEQLRKDGIQVHDARGDVTVMEDVQRVVNWISEELPPLAGVVHGAMVLRDEFLVDLDEAAFAEALRPKMLGAWNLHAATRNVPLDHFLCFSSFSAVVGGPKQSNYNAGNVFLEALAEYRQSQGLPATTIGWGVLSGAGFVERNQKTAQYLDKVGMKSFTMEEALKIFRDTLQYQVPHLIASHADWRALARLEAIGQSRTFAALTSENRKEQGAGGITAHVLAAPQEERLGILERFISQQMAAVCSIEASSIDHSTPLTKLGLDSLMAVELLNRIEGDTGRSVPMGKVLSGPTITELAETLLPMLTESAIEDSAASGPAATTSSGSGSLEVSEHRRSEFPLSDGQKAAWYLHTLAPENAGNHLAFAARCTPKLDVPLLNSALEWLVATHPMLRAGFHEVEGRVSQRIRDAAAATVQEHDDCQASPEALRDALQQRAHEPFQLSEPPLLRVDLFQESGSSNVLLVTMHPLVADTWSLVQSVQELLTTYFAIRAGSEPAVPEQKHSYQDFMEWQSKRWASESTEDSLTYWKEHLVGAPAWLDLPLEAEPAIDRRNPSSVLPFQLEAELSRRVAAFSAEHHVPLRQTLCAAYQLLLHRTCQQQDIVIGSWHSSRYPSEIRDLVGTVGNPLPLRSSVAGDPSFLELLKRTAGDHQLATEKHDVPIVRLIERLAVPRDPQRAPLFQAAFAMHRDLKLDPHGLAAILVSQKGLRCRIQDTSLEAIAVVVGNTPLDLSLAMEELAGTVHGCWRFDRDRWSPGAIEQLHESFVQLLDQLLQDPTLPASQYPIPGFPARKVSSEPNRAVVRELPFDRSDTVGSNGASDDELRTETERQVARIVQETLGIAAIGPTRDFFAAGGHSLAAVQLVGYLRESLGVDVTLRDFLAAPTVRALARRIDSATGDRIDSGRDRIRDFHPDARLDASIEVPAHHSLPEKLDRVLLTGATGFVGAFLLDALLKRTDAQVVCLVRAADAKKGRDRIRRNLLEYGLTLDSPDRISVLTGDLAQPLLGLTEDQFDHLGGQVDAIYHNGAVVSLLSTYEQLRGANVLGTQEILRLAVTGKLSPVHFVSTYAVYTAPENIGCGVITEDDPLPSGQSLGTGYWRSKSVAERLIQAGRQRGIPISIYRPGNVTGHSQTGVSNTGDFLHTLILSWLYLRSAPVIDQEIAIDVTPVDFVAEAIVELSRQPKLLGSNFHLMNSHPLELETLYRWMQASDLPVERVSFDQWRDEFLKLSEVAPTDMLGLLSQFLTTTGTDDPIPVAFQMRFDSRNTAAGLAGTGVQCPAVSDSLLERYLGFLRKVGFVELAEARATVGVE